MIFLTDDDICARCQNCLYRPGELSGCKEDGPAWMEGYISIICFKFRLLDYPEQNWDTEIRCDWGHGTAEARRLPTGGDGAVLLCRYHYDQEAETHEVPPWEELEVWVSE